MRKEALIKKSLKKLSVKIVIHPKTSFVWGNPQRIIETNDKNHILKTAFISVTPGDSVMKVISTKQGCSSLEKSFPSNDSKQSKNSKGKRKSIDASVVSVCKQRVNPFIRRIRATINDYKQQKVLGITESPDDPSISTTLEYFQRMADYNIRKSPRDHQKHYKQSEIMLLQQLESAIDKKFAQNFLVPIQSTMTKICDKYYRKCTVPNTPNISWIVNHLRYTPIKKMKIDQMEPFVISEYSILQHEIKGEISTDKSYFAISNREMYASTPKLDLEKLFEPDIPKAIMPNERKFCIFPGEPDLMYEGALQYLASYFFHTIWQENTEPASGILVLPMIQISHSLHEKAQFSYFIKTRFLT